MKIFNQDKTIELMEIDINYDLGRVVADKLLIAHHEEIAGKTVEELVQELTAQGKECEQGADGKWYDVVTVYDSGGKDVEEVQAIEQKDAYDEYEDIQVYIPYTEEELQERHMNALRYRRSELLAAFDKWEKAVLRGRENDDAAVMQWYRDLLDLEEIAFERVPPRIQYFISR